MRAILKADAFVETPGSNELPEKRVTAVMRFLIYVADVTLGFARLGLIPIPFSSLSRAVFLLPTRDRRDIDAFLPGFTSNNFRGACLQNDALIEDNEIRY